MATRARPRVVVPSTRRRARRKPPRAIAARQVAGEGAALVERLRACADVTATAFEHSESTRNNARANDVLEGLIRKARHQGDAFALIEAYDEERRAHVRVRGRHGAVGVGARRERGGGRATRARGARADGARAVRVPERDVRAEGVSTTRGGEDAVGGVRAVREEDGTEAVRDGAARGRR